MKKNSLYTLLFLCVFSFKLISQGDKFIRFNNIGINEGLSQSSAFSIVQDNKGFVWIATQDGLNKYDGKQFINYYHSQFDSNTIQSNSINTVFYDSNRNFLWVATNGGLNTINLKTNIIKTWEIDQDKRNEILQVVGDEQNQIWINIRGKGVYYLKNQTFVKVLPENVERIFVFENLLIASSNKTGFTINLNKKSYSQNENYNNLIGISRINFKEVLILKETSCGILKDNKYRNLQDIFPILQDVLYTTFLKDSSTIWLGSFKKGLFLIDIEKWTIQNYQHVLDEQYSLADNHITSIFKDYAGIVWVGTENNGMSLFDYTKQNIKYIGVKTNNKEGLSSKIVWSISSDEFGNIFIGTNNGFDLYNRFSGRTINYTIPSTNIRALYTKNQLLLGADKGLFMAHFIDGKLEFQNLFDGLPDSSFQGTKIYSIANYQKNNFLLGTNKGLLLFDVTTRDYKFYNTTNSTITSNDVRIVFKDRSNIWWAGTTYGLNKINMVGNVYYTFTSYIPNVNSNSMVGEIVTSICQDDSGYLWIGTYDGGLNRFNPKTNQFYNYSVNEGLSNNAIYGIVLANECLWISTNRGISSFNLKSKAFKNYYESDGLQSNEFNTGAYHATRYGELYFGGVNGISHFYPTDLKSNTNPPKLSITNIQVNNSDLGEIEKYRYTNPSHLKGIELNYTQNNISISFASLHFSNPAKNKYRYFIRELQDTSETVTSNGIANYASLSPGKYTLVIYASNADGVWTTEPLEFVILVKPPFWGTLWFKITAFLTLSLIILYLIRLRIRNVKKQKELLEDIVKRRTETVFKQKEQIEKQKEELEIEKDKANKVLYKIFPDRIADKLKNKGKVKAEHYETATIIFADFVRFSKISDSLSPEQLVGELNKYFKEFDKISVTNRLTQIKTIGDSYMAVGGIPKKNKTNPVDAVLAGLQIQQLMEELRAEDESVWHVRVGMNTGEIVAGVLETKRPLYDIWGSDVNIASRVQDQGKSGKVNISEKTYAFIKPYFNCTSRGGILTKNVGVINMYFVDSIKEELSINGEGLKPNKNFWKYVDLHNHGKIAYHELERDFLTFLGENLPFGLYYHSVDHTIDVVHSCERIALAENIIDNRLILLKTAALIHDSGFIKQYENNEAIGVEYAKEFLPKYGYSDEQIAKVCELILATNIAYKPTSKLERIIRDADLDYLGREDFQAISNRLYQELSEKGKVKSKLEWDELQISFFESHKYFTTYSKNNRSQKKWQNKASL